MTPVILASTSASRMEILSRAGVAFTALAPGVDEDRVKAAMLCQGASPRDVARELADLKALAVSEHRPGLVIGADQTLELAGVLYDKTRDLAATRARLIALRGREHRLHAATAVARDGLVVWRALETVRLTMRDFTDEFLEGYLRRHGEAVASSVGAYHLEGEGAQLFEAIHGDYLAVLGLPLIGLLAFLRQAGGLAR